MFLPLNLFADIKDYQSVILSQEHYLESIFHRAILDSLGFLTFYLAPSYITKLR